MHLDLCDVSKRLLILNQHLGELKALLWADPHYVPQQEYPVWSVAHLQKQQIIISFSQRSILTVYYIVSSNYSLTFLSTIFSP